MITGLTNWFWGDIDELYNTHKGKILMGNSTCMLEFAISFVVGQNLSRMNFWLNCICTSCTVAGLNYSTSYTVPQKHLLRSCRLFTVQYMIPYNAVRHAALFVQCCISLSRANRREFIFITALWWQLNIGAAYCISDDYIGSYVI